MRIRIGSGLLLVNLLVILLIVAILFSPADWLRIILGLPFLLFFPGYTLVLALFPRKEGLGGIERLALSLGLSIAVVPLIGLLLNYTQWGIRLEPVLYSVALFIFITSIIAGIRKSRLAPEERFSVEIGLGRLEGKGIGDKILSIILVLFIVGAIGALAYTVVMPKVGERFTEFYLLGADGQIANYPQELAIGERGQVIIGIINQEHETVTYRVEVMVDGVKNNEAGPVTLEHDEQWQAPLDFTPDKAGEDQKVEFLLFKNEGSQPYLRLHFWVDVAP